MMKKLSPFLITLLTACTLSACVTENYGNDKDAPIIENESSNNEKAMIRISLGLGYLKMGNTQQAKLNLEKAKRFSPNLVQVYTAFAHYYDTVGEPDLAIQGYEHALSLDDQDADTLNNYGVFLCRQEKYAAAEQRMLQAIAIPSYILVAQSYENLALCQLKAKQFTKAETYLKKAIAHSPNRASSLLQMMRLQYAKNDFKSAQTYLYRYEKSTRRFTADALALAFKIFAKQGNNRIAKNYANMLVKMFPNSFAAKQYILNELYQIDADKLAADYRATLLGDKSSKSKKRVVVLSPRAQPVEDTASLSRNGLQPIMANSVMPTAQQKAQLQVDEAKLIEQNKALTVSHQPSDNTVEVESVEQNIAVKTAVSPEEYIADGSESYDDAVLETKPNSKSAEEAEEAEEVEDNSQTKVIPMHTVEKGENLFAISKLYNIVMKSLARWNNLPAPYVLKVGDVLYLAEPEPAEQSQ